MKKFLSLCLSAALLFTLLMPSYALAAPAERKSATIGKNKASLVSIDMDGTRTGELTVGNNSVHKDMSMADHITKVKSGSGKSLIASVNGGFFDSYYNASKPLTYPENCAKTYAILVDKGEVIQGGGSSPMLGFTSDGRALIDMVKVVVKVQYRDDTFSIPIWGVNTFYSDPAAVMLFTDKMGYSVTIPQSSTMVYIKNNIITDIKAGATLNVPPDGTRVLVYNQAEWKNISSNYYEPQKGNYANVVTEFLPDRTETGSDWAGIVTAVGCGPWLLQNGKDVTSKNSAFTDPKLGINVAQGRTFAAVMPNGQLLFGTVNASFRSITDYLLSIGATDAMALDGGASSALYMEGTGHIQPAGRKLSNVLHIVQYPTSNLPAKTPAADFSTMSDWAAPDISGAHSNKLIPAGFKANYRTNITRSEFCDLIIELIKNNKGDDYTGLIYLTGVSYDEVRARFVDTYNISVLDCSRLGIVDGVGNNRFNPNGSITRQQAAKILKNVAEIVGISDMSSPMSFEDSSSIAAWANEGVDFVTATEIMTGKGTKFDPNGFFTKQEAVITVMRMFRKMP